ncbi:MAG: Holliday junction resolvase RuvX [Syntrophales bacterium LBB04]|nr:Holliday junction resolvase RuvX [Syntrophales bacterium LBB04]
MRVLGLDYGEKRIGVAICDELGLTAQGVAVIERKNKKRDLAALGHYVKTYGVEKIVIGYPLRLDGTTGIQCEKVDRFIKALASVFPIPIMRWDETLTTKDAEEFLRTANVRAKKRKAVVDKIAAGLILQGYLDASAQQSGTM